MIDDNGLAAGDFTIGLDKSHEALETPEYRNVGAE
jgi:hypothetical protein